MQRSNTISDKCVTSAEFAAVAPVLGRIMDSDIEDCLDVLDTLHGNSFHEFWTNMPRAVDVLSQCSLNPAGDNKIRREILGFIDGLGRVAGILSSLQVKVETHKLLSLQEQFQQELRRLKKLKATHRHIFICRASWSMLYQVSVVAVILSLLALSAWQFKRNRSMSDNDLKYRTILMIGGAQTQDIDTLETIFEYNRDSKRIRALRLQVQDYEYRVKLRAQKLEQMRRLGEEIEGLE